ncbi:transmembrane protein 106A isoform X1 [Ornithorhynchus anatinus]|uniref:Transmembrane protein 106A n=1 Tax=Ornithorhynchus anatinus TaxID=9258 RepID=A0A6I8PA31_ORNAN|nr:transmembrane protein 106A isoform X1 [Ornithorhynchus anatinus]
MRRWTPGGYGTINGEPGDPATCPSCRGAGTVPRELEKQLVALVPYGDQRLKPRHTKRYVSLAVLGCLLLAGLTFFFLSPRSIQAQLTGLTVSASAGAGAVILNVTKTLEIANGNLYPTVVTALDMEVLHLQLVVGQHTDRRPLYIGPLGRAQKNFTVVSEITDRNTCNICSWTKIKVHHVLLFLQGNVTCNSLGRAQQVAFQSTQYVDCRGHAPTPQPP